MTNSALKDGELRVTPPHNLLKKIADQNLTGQLRIVDRDQFKHIYFENSYITTAESSVPEEQLLEMIYFGGVISEKQKSDMQDLVRKKGWNDPDVLNIVDKDKQKWWLRAQIKEVILSLLEWDNGEYHFDSTVITPKHLPRVKMDTIQLVNNLIHRIKNLETLVNLMGGYKQILQTSMMENTLFSKYFSATDGYYLSRIDGTTCIKDLLSLAGNQKLEMAQSLVKFHLHGFIQGKLKPEPALETETQDSTDDASQYDETIADKEATEQESEHPEKDEFLLTDEIKLTDEELADLRMLAQSNISGDFLDLAKAMHLDLNERPGDVKYDDSIAYQRGEKFVDEQSGGFNIDGLQKIISADEFGENDDRISFIIDGRIVDGESDLFGGTLSSEIFTEKDEDKQWNMWLISEQEMMHDFEKDWTSTWSDWVENTAELNALQRELDQLESRFKNAHEDEDKEKYMLDMRRKSAEFQEIIRRKKREMFGIHRRMQLMNYYELLRVEQDADSETIRKAFEDWETHLLPSEEFIREFSSMAPQIAEIVNLMTTAYQNLSDQEKRQKYDDLLKEKERASKEMFKKKQRLAEDHMLSANTARRRGDNMLALRFIRGCISLDPNNSRYYSAMAELLAENEKWRKEALLFFHRAYHLSPEDQSILVNVAELAIRLNMKGFALRSLKQVLTKDPQNIKAKRLKRNLELTR